MLLTAHLCLAKCNFEKQDHMVWMSNDMALLPSLLCLLLSLQLLGGSSACENASCKLCFLGDVISRVFYF